MSSGHRPRTARATPSGQVPSGSLTMAIGLILGPILGVTLGGCVAGGSSPDGAVERRAAVDRWGRCVERQRDGATLSAVRAHLERGCEGHRRDVLRTFPPHLESRLERLLEERTDAVLRTRLRGGGASRDATGPMPRDAIDAFPSD